MANGRKKGIRLFLSGLGDLSGKFFAWDAGVAVLWF